MPFTEGNSVELVAVLGARYAGRISWLRDHPRDGTPVELPSNVTVADRRSVIAVWRYLRSEVVFFTHGLYGQVFPSRRQTFVNLWHGDGIKKKPTADASKRSLIPANWVSGGTRVLTARKCIDFKVSEECALVYGNPRVAQFIDGVPPSARSAIGLSDRPFVVWLPTFRHSTVSGHLGMRDSTLVDGLMVEVAQLLARSGIDLVIKPHRQDAESHAEVPGIRLSDHDLAEHGTTLYAVLGESLALLTDFSSVWTDYLVLDRPIGFVVPDAAEYSKSRGVFPADILDHLPGNAIRTRQDATAFVEDLRTASDRTRAQRVGTATYLGLVANPRPADDLLDALSARAAFVHGGLQPRRERKPLAIRSSRLEHA